MLNLVANGPSGYNINNSLRFRSSASAYLSRTPSVSNRQIFTWSGWVKRGKISAEGGMFGCGLNSNPTQNFFLIEFNASDNLYVLGVDSAANSLVLTTTQVFRDPSAWYHIVVAVDTTQATAANRVKIYVNGSQVTAFSTATYPTQNYNTYINTANVHVFGNIYNGGAPYFDGYLTEINFIDGQALTPSSFGSTNATTGVWQPAKYSGSYGTNGFYLPFTDNSALTTSSNVGLGKDFSGNSNYWVTNNISITAGTTYDSMKDVPTLTSATVANYAVLNPLVTPSTTTIINGNLGLSGYIGSSSVNSTMGVSSGKWYWEAINYTDFLGGVCSVPIGSYFPGQSGRTDNSCGWNSAYALNTTNTYVTGSISKYGTLSGSAAANGDIIGFALDMDAGNLYYYVNGTVTNSGNPVFTGITGTVFPSARNGSATNSSFNFGQRPFSYTPPTGYVALNTYNLPTPTILQGNKYMDATLYTGTGSGSPSINNAYGFKPDLVWAKCRNTAAQNNILVDSVRGANITLESNLTDAETALSTIASFTSTGFTTSGSVANGYAQNVSGYTYVAWQWQAGQGTTSSNTSGSITSTVSVNASAGFSIVTRAGTSSAGTIGHGLGVAPKMIITKGINYNGGNWGVYHASLGNTSALYLNLTLASTSSSAYWNNTSPTSTVFSIGTGNADFNSASYNYIAYCWAEIAGFSKFTSYVGNGSTDGTFVYLGFRPKFLLMKDTTLASDWYVYDTARDTYNAAPDTLNPNLSAVESGGRPIDVLSNGFKLRVGSGTNPNISGSTYIVAAWAENPFKNSLAR